MWYSNNMELNFKYQLLEYKPLVRHSEPIKTNMGMMVWEYVGDKPPVLTKWNGEPVTIVPKGTKIKKKISCMDELQEEIKEHIEKVEKLPENIEELCSQLKSDILINGKYWLYRVLFWGGVVWLSYLLLH